MYRKITLSLIFAAIWYTKPVVAHEMTPARVSLQWFGDNVRKAELKLTNMRQDIRFYEIGVFDADFKPVAFAPTQKVLRLDYLEKRPVVVFVRPNSGAHYICSESKLVGEVGSRAMIASRVCSVIR